MIIGGFQKFSLLDYPNEISAIIFTQGCNFRCPYCHNPQLVDPHRYTEITSEAEVLDLLRSRKGKLTAVTITGGEPCLQPDIIDFISKLKDLGFLVKLDTNGSFPSVVAELAKRKLVDYWAMDIKSPLPLYGILTRTIVNPEDILLSMETIRASGVPFEFRTTLFEELLTWNDVLAIRSILKPGDSLKLQQCRYDNTLEDLGRSISSDPISNPECQSLIQWGEAHRVEIGIR